jgi:putative restriction endonuclease
MPAIQPEELVEAILQAIQESGYTGLLISPVRRHPRRFTVIALDGTQAVLSVYAWTLTFGGRPQLRNEYRIQMTSVRSPLQIPGDGPAVLLGYEPNLRLFAGFDLARHRTFTTGSPSVQMDIEALRRAEAEGLSFHRKSNDEIAIGIRPDHLMNYALNAESLHRYGREGSTFRLLTRATALEEIAPEDVAALSTERRRIVQAVSRLSRLGSFRQQVLFAYGNRCAVTRVQLRLVEAAHILPVGAPGSSDSVRNGIALSPTYHRAYDNGLIYLDDEFRMRLNTHETGSLEGLNLHGGLEAFRAPLGRAVFLPPDRRQWPALDFIRRANRFRSILG